MESSLNSTTTPLTAKSVFLGKWEKTLYSCAYINIYSDTNCDIKFYSSQTKNTELNVRTIQYNAYQITSNYCIPLVLPYIAFNVINKSSNDQTILNFSVVYKDAFIELGKPVQAVSNESLDKMTFNEFDYLNVNDLNVASILTSNTLSVNDSGVAAILSSKYGNFLFDGAIANDGVSVVLNLSDMKTTMLTFYGTQDLASNTLTIQFSNDESTFYDSSFVNTVGPAADFGFVVNACPRYLRVKCSLACNLTLFCNAC